MHRIRRRLTAGMLAALALAAVTAQPSAAKPARPGPKVNVVMTSANLSWRLSRLPDLTFADSRPTGEPVVVVDDRIRYQRFTGVGAAMTDSSAWLIYRQLAAAPRSRLMNALFGRSGIHINFVRVPIG